MADINSLDDIFNSDEFGLLNTQNDVDIHTLKNVPKVAKRADADFVAKREKFDDFENNQEGYPLPTDWAYIDGSFNREDTEFCKFINGEA